jgi:DNA invertase Pin-like site-specific DNA recombinase
MMLLMEQAGAGFLSLTEVIDTTSPGGRLTMQMIGTFAEFEGAMLSERTQNGHDEARKQCCVGGGRPKLKMNQQDKNVNLANSGQKNAADASRLFNVHPATVSRILHCDKIP